MKAKYRDPFNYIYLDRVGIESLYAQTTDRLETELIKSREKERQGKLAAKVGVGAALRLLLNPGIEGEVSSTGKTAEQVKSALTIEHKLAGLINYLQSYASAKYFDNLARAADQCERSKRQVFVNLEQTFLDAPQFYESVRDPVGLVNEAKAIEFEVAEAPFTPRREAETYQYSDTYFKLYPKRLVMSASLDWFTRMRGGHMGAAGHEAVLLRLKHGRDVPYGVFGSLSWLGSDLWQLKPYAMWMP